MITYILSFVGIILLIKGANLLVDGSSSLAKKLGVSPLIVGLTIVAFGTSMPELVVSLLSTIKGTPQVVLGNIIGSNIANILLILGVTSIIWPIQIKRSVIRREIPFSILAALVLIIATNDYFTDPTQTSNLLKTEGLLMLCFFGIFLYYIVEFALKEKNHIIKHRIEIQEYKTSISSLMILGGLVGLFFGGKWTVEGAVTIARVIGMSEFAISATIVAIGTSLPELVTAITAARKKQVDLVVGNIIGSNIFNIFFVLATTASVASILIPSFINTDLIFLLAISCLFFIFMFIGKKRKLERWQGIIFVILFVCYNIFLIIRR
ncbi:sodium:proton exchanger [bacterium (Candidatus Torokbacteria) CG_4_10_14_0_2_um_filter_35_8]|nr:MAG: sodium:proton exchanger [bacterium (Candidatus Torokbacteria) CG_4_10_14_0_2_um_filter_35_8]